MIYDNVVTILQCYIMLRTHCLEYMYQKHFEYHICIYAVALLLEKPVLCKLTSLIWLSFIVTL